MPILREPVGYGNMGLQYHATKQDKDINEITWRGNLTTLNPGDSFNISYRCGGGENFHRILSDVALSYYVTNTSSTATEDVYLSTIWQIIDDLMIYLNGVLVFQSSDKNLSLYHRWFQNLLEKSENKEELASYICEENGQYLSTFTDALHDPCIIGDATSSGYYRTSLSSILPHIFRGLDTRYIYSIQIDGSIALDQVGRVHYDVGTLGNRVQIKDLSLKLIESRHMVEVIPQFRSQ